MAADRHSRRPAGADRAFDEFFLRRDRRRIPLWRDVPAVHSKQARQYRAPAKFRVSKTGIDVSGTNIPKDAIHRVIVRNHVLKAAGDVIIVADPHPNSGQQNTVAGMNWAVQKLGPISSRVDAEARGVPTTLAGGLTEPTAFAIMADVNKTLQIA